MKRLGYRFNIQNNRYLSGLQVYIAAQNLATITSYDGPDPEVRLTGNTILADSEFIVPGVDLRRTHLPAKTFILGVNVAF